MKKYREKLNTISRREFLKDSALISAAIGVGLNSSVFAASDYGQDGQLVAHADTRPCSSTFQNIRHSCSVVACSRTKV